MRITLFATLILMAACASTEEIESADPVVLSWNVSGHAFVDHPAEFRTILEYARPNIVLLDEVAPTADAAELLDALPDARWHISIGASGGRQRGAIASRFPLEALPEFAGVLPFPEEPRRRIEEMMEPREHARFASRLGDGIAVNAALVLAGGKRLLVVVADLECCGNDPASWAELKRRVEAEEIRRRVRQVLARTSVDAIILAGDFNLVSTPIPLVLLSGPYSPPNAGLIAAEVYGEDGRRTWTWDGRGTPFPSRALDYQLYSPATLRADTGRIIDTEDMSAKTLEQHGLSKNLTRSLSGHRPLVVEYAWQ